MTSENNFLEKTFKLTSRNTNPKQELIGGLTTFLSMVYSVIVIPNMLGSVGFDANSVFIATCIVSGIGTLLLGFWSNLPLAIGGAISLTAFTAFNLVLGQGISIPVATGAVILMGLVFLIITFTGIRKWLLNNIPTNIAIGTGIGIGLFLILIASNGIGFSITGKGGLPVIQGEFNTFPVLAAFTGLALIIGLEKLRVTGSILIVIILITIIGLIFDSNVHFSGIASLPKIDDNNHFFNFDLMGALNIAFLPIVFALVITAIFDATGTIRAVSDQSGIIDKNGSIPKANRALTSDSIANLIAGFLGTAPAAVYIESASGVAAGARTGLSSIVVGILFLITLFFAPLVTIVPSYATAPALMYVGLLMLSNVARMDFNDRVSLLSGLVTAAFIVLTTNIVTGIMLGFSMLLIARIIAGEWKKLNLGTVIIAIILFLFYILDLAI